MTSEDPLAAARGVLWGLVFMAAFYLWVGVVVYVALWVKG